MADDEGLADQAERRRREQAQEAATDLSRMGVDPAVLGLERASGAESQEPGVHVPTVEEPTTSPSDIVPLRPEFAPTPAAPAVPRERPKTALAGPVEELLARSAAGKPAPTGSGRVLRAVTFGLVTPDAAEVASNERDLVAALRSRQGERRVVAFASGKGGVGTTTVAIGVASALSALREDHTVLVDVRSGTAALSRMLGGDGAPSGRDLARRPDLSPAELRGGLRVVDGCGWGTPMRRSDVPGLVERLGEEHAFTLFDVGNDPGEAAHAVLARSDQTVVATCGGAWGLAAAQVASARLRDVDPFALDRVVYVIVCLHDDTHRRVQREVVDQLARGPARVVVVPPDPVLAAGRPFDPADARPATREAMLEVAAVIAMSGGMR